MRVGALGLAAAVLMAGCSTTASTGSPLVPDKVIRLTAKTSVSLASVATAGVVAAAVYLVYDPLAPNWEIKESRLNPDTYHLALKMKRYNTGGAGESLQVFKRRASELQYQNGYAGYEILEYTEGIDSQTLGARRVAEGTVKLVRREEADSFLQNEPPAN